MNDQRSGTDDATPDNTMTVAGESSAEQAAPPGERPVDVQTLWEEGRQTVRLLDVPVGTEITIKLPSNHGEPARIRFYDFGTTVTDGCWDGLKMWRDARRVMFA